MKTEINTAKYVVIKVIKRYLSEEEYKKFEAELEQYPKITDLRFIQIMKKHFDINRWKDSPLIPQDNWLHSFFTSNFKGSVALSGLLRKYHAFVFANDDEYFFKNKVEISKRKAPLSKKVQFIPNEEV